MVKIVITFFVLLISVKLSGQTKQPEDFGFRHFTILYHNDTVDILLKSRKGDELKTKPLFFFCQGSLPIPLIITDGNSAYRTFPFEVDSLLEYYHIAIVSKPFIPLIIDSKYLTPDFIYITPETGNAPIEYCKRNILDYYVDRNIHVINFLQKQIFISKEKLIVAGHSQGSAIAAKMAAVSKKVTHLIYASGNPFGQIMSKINQDRQRENDTTQLAEKDFENWESIINNKEDDLSCDSYRSTYSFSKPTAKYLLSLRIPVYVCYGSSDFTAQFNDYFRVQAIEAKKKNFTYKVYVGRDHNYFGTKPNGEIDYNNFGWDVVIKDWLKWLTSK